MSLPDFRQVFLWNKDYNLNTNELSSLLLLFVWFFLK